MACLPMASFVPNFNASLSLLTSSRRPLTMAASAISSSSRSGLLHCSFVGPASSISFSSNSAFSGASLGWELNSGFAAKPVKRQGLVVQASKFRLCQTKRNRSRKSLARTHGFRKRMSTTSGRAVIARRRAKGRWNLCPKSNPRSGKRA